MCVKEMTPSGGGRCWQTGWATRPVRYRVPLFFSSAVPEKVAEKGSVAVVSHSRIFFRAGVDPGGGTPPTPEVKNLPHCVEFRHKIVRSIFKVFFWGGGGGGGHRLSERSWISR